MLKLHGIRISNYTNLAKAALIEKGVEFEEVKDPPSRSDEFLARSPMGRVPALGTPDGFFSESWAIVDYLERVQAGTGAAAGGAVRARQDHRAVPPHRAQRGTGRPPLPAGGLLRRHGVRGKAGGDAKGPGAGRRRGGTAGGLRPLCRRQRVHGRGSVRVLFLRPLGPDREKDVRHRHPRRGPGISALLGRLAGRESIARVTADAS